MEDYPNKEHIVKILETENITYNVKRFKLSKPDSYTFKPGQATDIVINLPEWKKEKRPYTFTSLNDWNNLEFIIKIYDDHDGVTHQLGKLHAGDELILHDVFGAINYKGEGVFIAGGAGVTPFIAIFRYLQSKNEIGNNKLIFANKTKADIILEQEFKKLLGNNFINILSDEKIDGYANGQITEDFIKANSGGTNKIFYVCGPQPMMDAIEKQLANLHVDENSIVKEAF